jgi:hypothetical protein
MLLAAAVIVASILAAVVLVAWAFHALFGDDDWGV